MPNTRTENAVRLEFAPGSLVQANLSGAAFTGDWLWVAGDEACGLDRLRRLDHVGREVLRFGEVRDFPLADLLDLPVTAGEEADLEGMAVADGFLWVVGSHGLGGAANIERFEFHHMVVRPGGLHAGGMVKVAFDGEVTRLRPPLDFRVLDKPLQLLQPPDAPGEVAASSGAAR